MLPASVPPCFSRYRGLPTWSNDLLPDVPYSLGVRLDLRKPARVGPVERPRERARVDDQARSR